MKKKLLICLLILYISITALSATSREDSATLVIKGYKMEVPDTGDKSVKLEITSAVYDGSETSMNILPSQDGKININPKKNSLLASDSGTYNDFSSSTVFSFRAIGINPGSYWLRISFDPFYRYDSDGNRVENDKINAYYQIGSLNYSFPGETTNNQSPLEFEYDKDINVITFNTSQSGMAVPEIKWSLIGSTTFSWMVRGAVALSIFRTDYNNVDYGEYRSYITIEVGVTE